MDFSRNEKSERIKKFFPLKSHLCNFIFLSYVCAAVGGEMEVVMGISIGSDSLYSATTGIVNNKVKTESMEMTLNNTSATDDELMAACKNFESYLLEQVFKGMEKTVPKSEEDENPYLSQFGDMLYEEYAEKATENEGVGLAQMLYESMKRNTI
jgi:flagellar protein FlgJ